MSKLSEGMAEHNQKLKAENEVRDAAVEAAEKRKKEVEAAFAKVLVEVIAPAFREFRDELRKAGKDGQIVNSTKGSHLPFKAIVVSDHHLPPQDANVEQTLPPNVDISADRGVRFFQIFKAHEAISFQWRGVRHASPSNAPVQFEELTREKVDEMLLAFYRQAFPLRQ